MVWCKVFRLQSNVLKMNAQCKELRPSLRHLWQFPSDVVVSDRANQPEHPYVIADWCSLISRFMRIHLTMATLLFPIAVWIVYLYLGIGEVDGERDSGRANGQRNQWLRVLELAVAVEVGSEFREQLASGQLKLYMKATVRSEQWVQRTRDTQTQIRRQSCRDAVHWPPD